MNDLSVTQASFQDHVLKGDASISAEVGGPDEDFRIRRLAIYRDAYRLRLAEVLRNDYPALASLCGDEFDSIAEGYIAMHPSIFRNVRWFGGSLCAFLRQHPRYCGRPDLADLALFEWTLGLAFDAADGPAVAFTEVAAIAPEDWADLRFEAHPSLHVVKLRASAVAAWKAFSMDAEAAAPRQDCTEWAVWRQDLSPYFRSLDADEAWALAALRGDQSFGEICVGLCDWVAEVEAASRAARLLRTWIDDGWIAGFSVNRAPQSKSCIVGSGWQR